MRLSSTNLKWLLLQTVIGSFSFLCGGVVADGLSALQQYLLALIGGGLVAGLLYSLLLKDRKRRILFMFISGGMSLLAFMISFFMGYVLVDLVHIESELVLSLLLLSLYALIYSSAIAWVLDGMHAIFLSVLCTLAFVWILALLSPGLFVSYSNFSIIYGVFGAGIGCGHGLHLLKQRNF